MTLQTYLKYLKSHEDTPRSRYIKRLLDRLKSRKFNGEKYVQGGKYYGKAIQCDLLFEGWDVCGYRIAFEDERTPCIDVDYSLPKHKQIEIHTSLHEFA